MPSFVLHFILHVMCCIIVTWWSGSGGIQAWVLDDWLFPELTYNVLSGTVSNQPTYCDIVVWSWWDWSLIWTTIFVLQCCDTVGWVIRLVKLLLTSKRLAEKTVREMTLNVSGGTWNTTYVHSVSLIDWTSVLLHCVCVILQVRWWTCYVRTEWQNAAMRIVLTLRLTSVCHLTTALASRCL